VAINSPHSKGPSAWQEYRVQVCFPCPDCKQPLLTDAAATRQVQCPACGALAAVPDVEQAMPALRAQATEAVIPRPQPAPPAPSPDSLLPNLELGDTGDAALEVNLEEIKYDPFANEVPLVDRWAKWRSAAEEASKPEPKRDAGPDAADELEYLPELELDDPVEPVTVEFVPDSPPASTAPDPAALRTEFEISPADPASTPPLPELELVDDQGTLPPPLKFVDEEATDALPQFVQEEVTPAPALDLVDDDAIPGPPLDLVEDTGTPAPAPPADTTDRPPPAPAAPAAPLAELDDPHRAPLTVEESDLLPEEPPAAPPAVGITTLPPPLIIDEALPDEKEDAEAAERRQLRAKLQTRRRQLRVTALGLNLTSWSLLCLLAAISIFVVTVIALRLFLWVGLIVSMSSSYTPPTIAGALPVLVFVLFTVLTLLLIHGALYLIGSVLCCWVPPKSKARTHIIVSVALFGAAFVLIAVTFIVAVAAAVSGNGVVASLGGAATLVLTVLSALLVPAGFVFFLLFLRALAYYVKENATGEEVYSILVHWVVLLVLAFPVALVSWFFQVYIPPAAAVASALEGFWFWRWIIQWVRLFNAVGTIRAKMARDFGV
jgi:hypothetical protein